jgi:hypothetical protein
MQYNIKDNQREAITLAYIAGLIDGEGCIRIQKQSEKTHNPKYTPQISFTNTNHQSVELISNFFGGAKIYIHEPSKYGYPNRKICYRTYKAGSTSVAIILKKLLPYLLIKEQEAKLLIEYTDNFKPASGVGRNVKNGRFIGGRKRTPEESERREKIYQELKAIHDYRTRND